MKNIKRIGTVVLATIAISACSKLGLDPSGVTKEMKTAFKKDFPNAKHAKWEKEGDMCEVEFDNNKKSQEALYNSSAELVQVETEIEGYQLPANVNLYIANNYGEFKVEESKKVQKFDETTEYRGEVAINTDFQYEVELESVNDDNDDEEDDDDNDDEGNNNNDEGDDDEEENNNNDEGDDEDNDDEEGNNNSDEGDDDDNDDELTLIFNSDGSFVGQK